MNNSLKDYTVSGLYWSFIDNFANLGINFIIGIILARILSPNAFGLIGMITIIIAFLQTFFDVGFTQALIRKQECTQSDYSTVFWINLILGISFYLVLFLIAGIISTFFREPQLQSIIRILGISLIINSIAIVQKTKFIKILNFKIQTKISIIASTTSGVIAIMLAIYGYGVWSLVFKTMIYSLICTLLLWYWDKWRPKFLFSKRSFFELFSFGYKLLVSGLIDTLYRNIYYLIIGKYYTAYQLGLYTRADQFQALPSLNITSVIQRVSYPVLSSIQGDKVKLKEAYQKLIKSTMLITFVIMLGMAAVAKPMIIALIGEKWLPSVVYLQMLCFVGMLYPLHALNLNMLNVQGRSDLFLRLEIIKKLLAVPTIIIGVIFGIKIMIAGMIINSFIAYYLNSYWSGRFINYCMKEQIKDIIPSFLLAAGVAITVFVIGYSLPKSYLISLIVQVITGIVLVIGICELTKMADYLYIKQIILEKVFKRR